MSDLKPVDEYKYANVLHFMTTFTISASGTTFDVPGSQIMAFEIIKNFDSEIYPLAYCSVNVPLWFWRNVMEDIDAVTVTINLQYKYSLDDTAMKSTSGLKKDLSGCFKAVMIEQSQQQNTNIHSTVTDIDDSKDDTYAYNEYAFLEFNLYNSAAYKASFTKINGVFSSINMQDSLVWCLNQGGISKMLMYKADNSSSYAEFKILPDTIMQNMMRIVDDYEFHSDGSVFFFDLELAYLIPKKVGCVAYETEEWKKVIFECYSELADPLANFDGVYEDGEPKVYRIHISKEAYTASDINTNQLADSDDHELFLRIALTNCCMSIIKPNKEYVVALEGDGAEYNGSYRLHSYAIKFVKQGEFFNASWVITLVK